MVNTVSPIIFATFLAPAWYKTYQYITEYVERYVHTPTFLLNGESLEDFSAEYVDAGFLSPLAYLQLLDQQPCPVELIAAPVTVGASDPAIPPSLYAIVVRRDSTFTTVDALPNCVWASYTEITHVAEPSMLVQGSTLTDFRGCVEAVSQAQALHMVISGTADATAIDVRRLNLVLRNSPALTAKLRVISTYCPSAGPLVVVSRLVAPQLRLKIQEAFLMIHKDPLCAPRLRESVIDKFIFVSNVYYKNLREQSSVFFDTSYASESSMNALEIFTASISG
jgi:ABC-type phosphate/phosphonate transport system, periplasmic component